MSTYTTAAAGMMQPAGECNQSYWFTSQVALPMHQRCHHHHNHPRLRRKGTRMSEHGTMWRNKDCKRLSAFASTRRRTGSIVSTENCNLAVRVHTSDPDHGEPNSLHSQVISMQPNCYSLSILSTLPRHTAVLVGREFNTRI